MRKFLKIKWGFSLAEMMVVMVVLSIIISAAAPIITKRSVSKYKAKPAYPGTILMWYGDINNVPIGYALCDGGNNTPDLRDRFIVMAGSSSYPLNATGGNNTVPLDNVNYLPAHNHTPIGGMNTNTVSGHAHTFNTTSTASTHSHNGTYSIGGVSADHQHYQGGLSRISPLYSYSSTSSLYGSGNTSRTMYYNSITTSNGANHSHTFTTDTVTSEHSGSIESPVINTTHTHGYTISSVGSGTAHENRPPYYALAFIMKK